MRRSEARPVTVRELVRSAHVVPELRVERKRVLLIVGVPVPESVEDPAEESVELNLSLQRMVKLVVREIVRAVGAVRIGADEKCKVAGRTDTEARHEILRDRIRTSEGEGAVIFVFVCFRDLIGPRLDGGGIMVSPGLCNDINHARLRVPVIGIETAGLDADRLDGVGGNGKTRGPAPDRARLSPRLDLRSEEHTSELQSLA